VSYSEKAIEYEFKDFQKRWPNMFKKVYCGFNLPRGWNTVVWKLCDRLESLGCEEPDVFQVAQVKEKFGGLRFYYGFDKEVDNETRASARTYVEFSESMSFYVCQTCGTTIDVCFTSDNAWYNTRCTPCRSQSKKYHISF